MDNQSEKHDPMYNSGGKFSTSVNNRSSREYQLWYSMRARCYKNSRHAKDSSYAACNVSPEFYDFQEFSAWATEQIGYSHGYDIDKDLLEKGNCTYSQDLCVFLPQALNIVLQRNQARRAGKILPIGVRINNKAKAGRPYMAAMSRHAKTFFIGTYDTIECAFAAYKTAKEQHIKDLAEQYRDTIDPRAYLALMAYQVEITD